jgi:hypothetical protein
MTLPAVRYSPLPDNAAAAGQIVESVLDLVDPTALPGTIPAVGEFKTMAERYNDWLTETAVG